MNLFSAVMHKVISITFYLPFMFMVFMIDDIA